MLVTGVVLMVVFVVHGDLPSTTTAPQQANVVALLPPSNLTIHYLGRTLLVPKSGGEEEHVAYDFSMVTIGVGVNVSAISSNNTIAARFRFQCMNAAGEPARKGNRIQIKLNGVPLGSNPVIDMGTSAMQARCNTIVSVPLFTTAEALASLGGASTSQVATLSLVKLTEPDYDNSDLPAGKDNSIRFYGLEVTNPNPNSTVVANMFVQPANVSSSSHRFHFIGDSIASGFQIMCPANNRNPSTSYALGNVSAAYTGQTCAEFGAECHVEAWSGRGAVRNYDLSIVTTMAVIATRTIGSLQCPTTSSTCNNTWSYPASWIPTAILYNLGTNDHGNSPEPTNFTEGVVAMITNLASKYAPHIPPVALQ